MQQLFAMCNRSQSRATKGSRLLVYFSRLYCICMKPGIFLLAQLLRINKGVENEQSIISKETQKAKR